MKQDYLKQLKLLLDNYRMEDKEKQDILTDYDDMYENYRDFGMSETDIEVKLGDPNRIIHDLTEGYAKVGDAVELSPGKTKAIALSPFAALLLFFVGGFLFDGWTYSWMAFLLIPVTAITLNMAGSDKHLFTALSPFAALIAFFVLGFVFELWHPGWLVFTVIPFIAITTEIKTMKPLEYLTAISFFLILPVYVLYFGERDLWIPGWLIFLAIPAIGALNEKSLLKILIWELLIVGGVAGYLWIGEAYDRFDLALLAFLPLVSYALLREEGGIRQMPKEYRYLLLLSVVVYVALGLLFDLWGYAWLVFLSIPVYAIYTNAEGSARIIGIMPFVATFLFMTLGWFFDLWAFAWMAYLLIPVVAIIKEA